MEISNDTKSEALIAAMRKAVEVGIFPKVAPQEIGLEIWEKMLQILEAAFKVVGIRTEE